MKTLIAYCSRHGSAKKIANLLLMEIHPGPICMIDLVKDPFPKDLNKYDQIIVGGSIHFGNIQPGVKEFCHVFHKELMTKRLGLFMCYMLEDRAEEEFNNAFDEDLRNHAFALGYFGGELLIDKMNFIEKFVVHNIMKEKDTVFRLNEFEVDSFIGKANH